MPSSTFAPLRLTPLLKKNPLFENEDCESGVESEMMKLKSQMKSERKSSLAEKCPFWV